MRAYVLRRLLLMIPTFVGISLILFLILNLAPGRPGAQGSANLADSARGDTTQESYRIFREQFHLDDPVLFNTRFALTRDDVLGDVTVAAGLVKASSGERIGAQERLEDLGEYGVPHLVALLDHGDARVRDAAAYFLRVTAVRPLVDPFNPSPGDELRRTNRAIDRENAELRELRYAFDAPEAKKREIQAAWKRWFEKRRERFDYDFGERLRILFLDTRFAHYWGNLLELDFGVSLVSREPVVRTLLTKLKYSLTLSVGSLVLAYLIAIPLGVFSAVRRGTRADRVVTTGLFMLYSLPSFFVATLLLYGFSLGANHPALRLFPTGGWQSANAADMTTLERLADVAWHVVLPLACMTYGSLAALSRYMRAGLLEVLQADFIRTARAKGLSERAVIGKHALRNGLLPIVTLLAGLLPAVLGGSVIVEVIFGIPGMGQWIVESIYQRDYNVILAVQLSSTVLVLFGLLLTDLGYALVDPRIRFG
ncbi:MAG TPA: ABC transporter permease [Polyangiaceae bacterium]